MITTTAMAAIRTSDFCLLTLIIDDSEYSQLQLQGKYHGGFGIFCNKIIKSGADPGF